MKNQELKKTWNKIVSVKSVALACHVSPDGDTLGTALALAHILKQCGVDAQVFSQDPVPENYRFMAEVDTVKTSSSQVFDLGLLIDSNSLRRVGDTADIIQQAKIHGSIDHHLPTETFGDVRYVDERSSSAVEVLMDILLANDISIDAIAAQQLMTGLVTDTGVFRFSNVSKKTFEYAAVLVECGACVEDVVHYVYESRSMGALKLQGYVLSNIQTSCDGKIAWVALSKDFLNSLNVMDEETDGVVDHIRKLKGSVAAMLIRETAPNTIKISLRSRDDFDVSKPANALGGGGHICASGCTLNMSLDDAAKTVVSEVQKWMAS